MKDTKALEPAPAGMTGLRVKASGALCSLPAVSAMIGTTGRIKQMPGPVSLQLMAFGISVTVLTLALFAFKAVNTAQSISGLPGGRIG